MDEKTDWIYCRLVDRGSFIFPRSTFWFGQFELSSEPERDARCAQELRRSMDVFAIAEAGDGWARLLRARTLLLDSTHVDAMRTGELHLKETIQLFNRQLVFGVPRLTIKDAGYVYDLRENRTSPLLPLLDSGPPIGAAGFTDDVAHHPDLLLNTMLVAGADVFGELGSAFRRSSHWQELASAADDQGERILLYWMAAECLCKTSHDEPITPKLLAVLGMPTGRLAAQVPTTQQAALTKVPRLRVWRKQLQALAEALRNTRNRIVHAGYRRIDLGSVLSDVDLTLADKLLPMLVGCLGDMALAALSRQVRSIGEMWAAYPAVLWPHTIADRAQWCIERCEARGRDLLSRLYGYAKVE